MPGGHRVIKAFWTRRCGCPRFSEPVFHARPSAKKGRIRSPGFEGLRGNAKGFLGPSPGQTLWNPGALREAEEAATWFRSRAEGGEGALWPATARLGSAAVAPALPQRH
ncbi:Hypothetical predicted protein [Marmota monax]|uniref:Uncharacterized protein n=1 Tax=Marmota monax TaxID=9995 RepID=A0A5E4CW95_MARMO|nr:hypothetical protein GHT09_014156 [Marmota monax]VTJ86063.1 Hypothetical predicted protein [Marmota monax]